MEIVEKLQYHTCSVLSLTPTVKIWPAACSPPKSLGSKIIGGCLDSILANGADVRLTPTPFIKRAWYVNLENKCLI